MSRNPKFRSLSASFFLLLLLSLSISAQTAGGQQEVRATAADSPMTQDEVVTRVRNARSKGFDFDDIAADIDRRGINFQVEDSFANLIRFMRATVVSIALYRADDRRKAIIAKPKNPGTLEELPSYSKHELSSLPFIEQARAVANAYVKSLPNFLVREQVQRYERPLSGNWKLGDYLELAVSYAADRGEDVKLKLQNGKGATVTLDQIGGLTSTGQFAGQLAMLFNPDTRTDFIDQGEVNFYGQSCMLYSYRVATRNSRYLLKVEKSQVNTGYRGKIYINRDTKQVVRICRIGFRCKGQSQFSNRARQIVLL